MPHAWPGSNNLDQATGGQFVSSGDISNELQHRNAPQVTGQDHPTATTFAKMMKGEKVERLEALFRGEGDLRSALAVTKKQAAWIAAWLPEGMT